MTEAEWLASADPSPMLEFLSGKASDRKLRLFACACCRLWPISRKGQSPQSADVAACVLAAEKWADGDEEAGAALRRLLGEIAPGNPAWQTPSGVAHLRSEAMASAREFQKAASYGKGPLVAGLLRDLFGNPFRRVAVAPTWRTPAVVSLAQAGYQERRLPGGKLDPLRLKILADALEEAGCSEEELLGHLRSAGPHVRGCWALDLLLGKS